MTRRERLQSIIRQLSQRSGFTVTIGNSYRHNPFAGRHSDGLEYLTDEGLEIVARDLAKMRARDNRRRAENELRRRSA